MSTNIPFWFQAAADAGATPEPMEGSMLFTGGLHMYQANQDSVTSSATFTISFWAKRGVLDSTTNIVGARYNLNNTGSRLSFDSSNRISIENYGASLPSFQWQTLSTFEDTTSWYHILIQFEHQQDGDADRVRLWVNGKRITSWNTKTGNPDATMFNYPGIGNGTNNVNWVLGGNPQDVTGSSANNKFHGKLADFRLYDGKHVYPEELGGYTSDNIWVPIAEETTFTGTQDRHYKFLTSTVGFNSAQTEPSWMTLTNSGPPEVSDTTATNYVLRDDSPTDNKAVFQPKIKPPGNALNYYHSLHGISAPSGSGGGGMYAETTASFQASGKQFLFASSGFEYQSAQLAAVRRYAGFNNNYDSLAGGDGFGFSLGSGNFFENGLSQTPSYSNPIFNGVGSGYQNQYIWIAYDADAGKLWCVSSQNTTFPGWSGDPVAGTGAQVTNLFLSDVGQYVVGFRQGAAGGSYGGSFSRGVESQSACPTGYKNITAQNFPDKSVTKTSDHFRVLTAPGTATITDEITTITTSTQPEYTSGATTSGPSGHTVAQWADRVFNGIVTEGSVGDSSAGNTITFASPLTGTSLRLYGQTGAHAAKFLINGTQYGGAGQSSAPPTWHGPFTISNLSSIGFSGDGTYSAYITAIELDGKLLRNNGTDATVTFASNQDLASFSSGDTIIKFTDTTTTAHVEAVNAGSNQLDISAINFVTPEMPIEVGDQLYKSGTRDAIRPYAQKQFTNQLVWIRSTGGTDHSYLLDSTRPDNQQLSCPQNGSAAANYSAGSADQVAWVWNAGDAFSNSSGTNGATVASTGYANPDAGFSIVTWDGTSGQIAHGIGREPKFIMARRTGLNERWYVYHRDLASANHWIALSETTQENSYTGIWGGTRPTSTVFTTGTDNGVSGGTMVAYCWADIPGYSAIGRYIGNNSSPGPVIVLGFRPKFVLIKDAEQNTEWEIYDDVRNPGNPTKSYLYPSNTTLQGNKSIVRFLANGFRIDGSDTNLNQSGQSHIFMAFAEHPFGAADGTPATAYFE